MKQSAFAFMGGTFDPIHNGHLRTALELQHWLGVDQLCLIPSKTPVHRATPGRTSQQRLEMVQLAVANEPSLCADEREICSEQPSYSSLTLQGLRSELGDTCPIYMIMGMDSYMTLPSWFEWQKFTDYCHIVVVKRPGYELPKEGEIAQFTAEHKAQSLEQTLTMPAGKVLFHELTPLGISATQIRENIAQGLSPRYLFPDGVWQYIQDNRLYGLTN